MAKIVINTCFGGFSLSREAYEWLIAHGVKVGPYIEEKRDPETERYVPVPENEGEIIFNTGGLFPTDKYWEVFIDKKRDWPLLVQCVEELGEAANGPYAELKVVEIPDGVEWEIDEYDGREHIAESHRKWN